MRHLTPISILAGLVLLLSLSACELANIGDPIVVADVEDEFYIMPLEQLTPGERPLQFDIETISDEPCANAVIDARLTKVSYQLRLSLKDIIAPSDCIPGAAPARTRLGAGALPSGYYRLTIDLKGEVVNEGQITVRGDRYLIEMESTNGFTLPYKELLRIPENTVWGYVVYDTEADAPLASEFQESLAAISEEGDFTQGQYGHFQVAGEQVAVREAPKTLRIRQFAYEYAGADDVLTQLVEQYREAHSAQLEIHLFNDDGKVF